MGLVNSRGIRLVGLALAASAGCSSGASSGGEPPPPPLPATPIPFQEASLGRGLANPGEVLLSPSGRWVLVLERGAGRVVRVDRDDPGSPLERIEAPDGVFVGMEPLPGGDAVLLLAGRPESGAVSRPEVESVANGTIHRLDVASLTLTTVLEGFEGTGFLVDPTGERVLSLLPGEGSARPLAWRSLVDGGRTLLTSCAGRLPEALDASGRFLFTNRLIASGVNTGTLYVPERCDLASGAAIESISGTVEVVSLSNACGEVLGGVPTGRFVDSQRGELFRVVDPTVPAPGRVFAAAPDAPIQIPDTIGPAASDAACSELWFTAPTGLYRHEVASGRTERVVPSAGLPGAVTVDRATGEVLVTSLHDQGFGPLRLDLDDGTLEPWWPALRMRLPPPRAIVLGADELFALSLVLGGRNAFGAALEPYDRETGEHRDTGTATLWLTDLAACESGEMYASGAPISVDTPSGSSGAGSLITRVHPERFEAFEPLVLAEEGAPDGRATHVALGSGCRLAFLLVDGALAAYDLRAARWVDLPPVRGTAIALDPSGALLYVAGEGALRALHVEHGELSTIATGLPPVSRMAVTPDRRVVLLGRDTLALGVVDLEAGTASRLWEGYGDRGSWSGDRFG